MCLCRSSSTLHRVRRETNLDNEEEHEYYSMVHHYFLKLSNKCVQARCTHVLAHNNYLQHNGLDHDVDSCLVLAVYVFGILSISIRYDPNGFVKRVNSNINCHDFQQFSKIFDCSPFSNFELPVYSSLTDGVIQTSSFWISVRFVFVTIVWRLLRRIAGAMIPYRITRVDAGTGKKGKKQNRCSAASIVTALVALCSSLLSLATIGTFVLNFETADDGDRQQYCVASALKFMVSILCAFGMIVASLLNGFGCASMPHANLVGIFLKPTPPSVISKVEDDFHYAMKTLDEKRWMLADGIHSPSSSSSFTPSKNKASSEKQTMKQLQEEIIFLQALVGDMNDDIEEMKQSQRLAAAARTAMGRIRGILGAVFSIVLIVRVVLAANSFLSVPEGDDNGVDALDDSNSRKDPLTSVSLWLLGRNIVKTREQYDLFRQGTSLVLAGVLSASQVRSFFRVVGALGRRLSRTCGIGGGGDASFGRMASSRTLPSNSSALAGQCGTGRRRTTGNDAALLLSSFVMGCYFLACVTVVKMTLPIEYRSSFTTAVGLNFNFNTRFLNMVFFGSACASAAMLASLFGIQRNNSERYRLESQPSSASAQLA